MPEFNATKYANEYIAKNYDRLSLAFPGGAKARFQAHVDGHPDKYKSITDFLFQAANAQIDRDNGITSSPQEAAEEAKAPSPIPSSPAPVQTVTAKPIPIHPTPGGSGMTLEEVLARKRADIAAQQEAEAFEQRQKHPRAKTEEDAE